MFTFSGYTKHYTKIESDRSSALAPNVTQNAHSATIGFGHKALVEIRLRPNICMY